MDEERSVYDCAKCENQVCENCIVKSLVNVCKNCIPVDIDNNLIRLTLSESLSSDSEATGGSIGVLQRQLSASELVNLITAQNHWVCRSCGIYGTYKSPHIYYCGGAYFGWLIGATPTEGRTCCNCVKRVTGSDAGYIFWSCSQCKCRKAALERMDYSNAGFEVGMSRLPLNSAEGLKWLHTEAGEQSGPQWLHQVPKLDLSDVQFPSWELFFKLPIYTYTNLTAINISNNATIETIPIAELCSMEKLLDFECHNCPRLISPPPEISIQGGKAAMKFMRALIDDGKRNTRMVLFLIGDGESGKTSLLSALRATDHRAVKIHRDNRTVGIDISKWSLQESDSIDFTVYDMAGQSIYKDTHTYFVGRRAIYVFVWSFVPNVSASDLHLRFKAMVESWIDTLQFRVPGATVMVVATHSDCVTKAEIDFQSKEIAAIIQDRVQSFRASECIPMRVWNDGMSIIVNSLDGEGIVECRNQLIRFAKSIPWYNELLPQSWIFIEIYLQELVEKEKQYYLSWSGYRNVLSNMNVPLDMIPCITRFFHETGKIRYFGLGESVGGKMDNRYGAGSRRKNSVGTAVGATNTNSSTDATTTNESENMEVHGRPKSRSLVSTMESFYKRLTGNKQPKSVLEKMESFGISGEDVEETLNDTVYISPQWLCNVLKGVVRHERDSILRFFIKTNNQLYLRRIKRLLKFARMHYSLAEYIYPTTAMSKDYWSNHLNLYERDLWTEDVVQSETDIIRAFSLLSGFDLVAVKGQEIIIPSLLSGNNFLQVTNTQDGIEYSHGFIAEYMSLPSGFFERLIIRLNRIMSHIDMSSCASYMYMLGNVGNVFLTRDVTSKLTVNTSSKAMISEIKNEIVKVEEFFPGLLRLNAVDTLSDPSVRDDIQLLLISYTSKSTTPIEEGIRLKFPNLIIYKHSNSGKRTQDKYLLNSRVAVVCMDKFILNSKHLVNLIHALHEVGTYIIPVILEGYEITDYTKWWPPELPELESHKLFVDLRSDINLKIKKELMPVIIKKLNDWRGKSVRYDDSSVLASTLASIIKCEQCIVDCCPTIATFDRDQCSKYIQSWYSEQLRLNNGSYVSITDIHPMLCENGHSCDPSILMDQASVRDTIPCPCCVQVGVSKPYLFNREELILKFEDDIKKVGVVNCPQCMASSRPGTFQIVDILNTDVFVSYNWGPGKINQTFVIPFIRKVELDTNILCWVDIHGGLSAGQDHLNEMKRGVTKCSIFIMFLTDDYVVSGNCQREFIDCVKSRKYIIPVLVPTLKNGESKSTGWSGNCDPWWKHIENFPSSWYDPDNKCDKIPWYILQNFQPIDLRMYTEVDILTTAGEELVCRVLSRLRRGRNTVAYDLL